MSKHEYPKYLFHKEGDSKVVHSAEEHAEHGDEWAEEPFAAGEAAIENEPEKPKGKPGRKPKAKATDSPEETE